MGVVPADAGCPRWAVGAGAGAGRLSPVDLIRGPRRGGVLSNVWTGATPPPGDLKASLGGSGAWDRDGGVARARTTDSSFGFASAAGMVEVRPRRAAARDSLSPAAFASLAELSTAVLRLALGGRCARPWITSGRVSGAWWPGNAVLSLNCENRTMSSSCFPISLAGAGITSAPQARPRPRVFNVRHAPDLTAPAPKLPSIPGRPTTDEFGWERTRPASRP